MGRRGKSTGELLVDIVLWAERTGRFVAGVSQADFAEDEMRQMAVAKCIEAIGEAAGNILKRDPLWAEAHPEIELAEAYRMRNRLSHGYDTIDTKVLWDTANHSIPALSASFRLIDLNRNG